VSTLGAQAAVREIHTRGRVSTFGGLSLLQPSKAALAAPAVNPKGEPTHPNEAEQAEYKAERERDHPVDRIEASY
jgi:hypothetical protein